jgi:hypothetical protein
MIIDIYSSDNLSQVLCGTAAENYSLHFTADRNTADFNADRPSCILLLFLVHGENNDIMNNENKCRMSVKYHHFSSFSFVAYLIF